MPFIRIISSGPPVRMIVICGLDLQVTEHAGNLVAAGSVLNAPVSVDIVDSEAPDSVKLASDTSGEVAIYVGKQQQPGLGYPGQLFVGHKSLGLFCSYVDFSYFK